jgi:hypothetical protein
MTGGGRSSCDCRDDPAHPLRHGRRGARRPRLDALAGARRADPFVVGGVLAFALAPLVERLAVVFPFYRTRRELARTLAIILVYITGLSVIAAAGSIMIPAIINETGDFIDRLPELVEQSRTEGRSGPTATGSASP